MEVEQLKNMGLKLISAVSNVGSSTTVSPPDSSTVLQDLKTGAEACCSAYSGKKTLVTDQDSCVSNLLNQWFIVLTHGLKVPASTYPPLHNIITAGLNFAFNLKLLDTCLWNYTKLHLTKHEEERFTLLKTINTPLGYFKAFLRSSHNEKSLERYLQSWIGHNLRTEYYEEWSLVRDPNNAKLLPDIAAGGLSSIFFALVIDKAELNEPSLVTPNAVTPEPVIDDTPIVKSTAKNIHRQIISFDSDENSHLKLVNIVERDVSPNTYQSDTASSSYEIKNSFLPNDLSSTTESPKEALSRLIEKSREIFIEKNRLSDSGSHQDSDVSSNNGEYKKTLENRIDEVFMEDKMSCLELCFPTDDNVENEECNRSNLLMKQYEQNNLLQLKISQMEDEFNERSSQMEKVIYNLTRENNKLKDQLRNYVSAVETLKQEDTRNDEAKHYEEKLVQVAQMHAELMEFNQVLQRQLQSQIEPFGAHYPLSSLTGISDSRVNVWIPSTFLISKESKSFHIYQVFLKVGCEEWNVYRRYSEFRELYGALKNSHPDMSSCKFPPKKTIGKKEAWLVEKRRNQLQTWLRHVIQVLPQLRQSSSRNELTSLLPFFKDPGTYLNILHATSP